MSFIRSKQTFIEFLLQGLYSSRWWIWHEQQSLLLIAADFVRRKTQSTQAVSYQSASMASQILSPRCTFSWEEEDEEEKEERAGVVSAWKFGEMYPLSSSSFLCVGFGFLHYYTQVFVLATILANLATTLLLLLLLLYRNFFTPFFLHCHTVSSHLYCFYTKIRNHVILKALCQVHVSTIAFYKPV